MSVEQPVHEYRGSATRALEIAVAVPVVLGLVWAGVRDPGPFLNPVLIGWVALVAALDLMLVPGPDTPAQFSVSFPILLAAEFLFVPQVAAAIAFAGAFDRRELQRSIPVSKSLFIRAEIALSALTGSLVFHTLGSLASPWFRLAPAAAAGMVADYGVNALLVGLYLAVAYRMEIPATLSNLRVGSGVEFLVTYVALGAFGAAGAIVYAHEGPGVALLLFGPVLVSRQMFHRTQELRLEREELRSALGSLERLEGERLRLVERTLAAAEDERRRLAAELHDGPIQHLAAAVYRLEDVGGALGDRTELAEAVERTQEELRDEVLELREIVSRLRPPVLDQLGLEEALREHVEAVRRATDLDCRIEVRLPERLDPDLETVLYRVSQEALTNVAKHARAEHVRVGLAEEDGAVTLRIVDDGIGFLAGEGTGAPGAAQGEHVGLIAMRERVERVGGAWEILSSPGEGTEVRAVFRKPAPA